MTYCRGWATASTGPNFGICHALHLRTIVARGSSSETMASHGNARVTCTKPREHVRYHTRSCTPHTQEHSCRTGNECSCERSHRPPSAPVRGWRHRGPRSVSLIRHHSAQNLRLGTAKRHSQGVRECHAVPCTSAGAGRASASAA